MCFSYIFSFLSVEDDLLFKLRDSKNYSYEYIDHRQAMKAFFSVRYI